MGMSNEANPRTRRPQGHEIDGLAPAAEGLLPGEAVDVSELSDHALAGKGSRRAVPARGRHDGTVRAPGEEIDANDECQLMTWLPPSEFAAAAGRWTL